MVFKDLFEPIGPRLARRPFDQPLEYVFGGHIPARFMKLFVATAAVYQASATGSIWNRIGRENSTGFSQLPALA